MGPSQEQNQALTHASTPSHQAKPRRTGWWRRRRFLIPAGLVLAAVLVFSWSMRSPSPVGHWDSAEGQDRFLNAYDESFTDMPETAETFDIRTDFGVVRAYQFEGQGDGPPSVLLPGRASASPVWADNMASLLALGDVYTIDLLGEPGRSVQERPITNDADQAAWLNQVLLQLPPDQFHVMGLSIGGWTAANLALHHPESVTAMTLIDPVFVFDDMPLETVLRSIPAAFSWMPKSWRDGFNSYTAGGAPVEDVPVAEMIEAGMQHYSLRLPQPTRISEDQLTELELPVLAIIASESVMLDAEDAAQTAERALPAGTVRVYEGASHAVSGEEPEQIAQDVLDFLAD
ncbi:alpha/beta hydrolase [Nesterenkonia rhizosphaerae]|uniref:Alpha/beta hydrolase n=1 Tax=Nesterenkonia rhizosphaerae TaxID=1348272 RepID=A0ABP9G1S4_9MICC